MRLKYETIDFTEFRGRIIWRLRVANSMDLDSYRDYIIRLRSNGSEVVVKASYYGKEKQFVVIGDSINPEKMRRGELEILAIL